MICSDCTAAATNPNWGGYHAHCQGCQVRALALGLHFFESRTGGGITPAYRACLRTLFGDEAKQGHERVKAESIRIGALRNTSKRK